MKKIMLMVAGLVLATAAPVAAGRICPAGGDHCQPPVLEATVDVDICGDPREWNRYQNTGTVDIETKWVFRKGELQTGGRTEVLRDVAAGQTKIVGPRWIRGEGARVKIWVRVAGATDWGAPVISFRQQRFGDAWGTGDCPADRFGTPTFEDPRYSATIGPVVLDA